MAPPDTRDCARGAGATVPDSVSLTLGVIGVYLALLYIVMQRTSEIGVRLPLGADPRSGAAGGLDVTGGETLPRDYETP